MHFERMCVEAASSSRERGEGDVERLLRIGRARACKRVLLTYLKFCRYFSISLPGFIPRQKSEAVHGLGTRPGYN